MSDAPTVLSQIFFWARLWATCKVNEHTMAHMSTIDGLRRNSGKAREAAVRRTPATGWPDTERR